MYLKKPHRNYVGHKMSFLSGLRKVTPLKIPFTGFSEEERYLPPAMDQRAEMGDIEEDHVRPIAQESDAFNVHGFIDGVQRSVLWEVVKAPNGAKVPLLAGQIVAGVLWRGADKIPRQGFRKQWFILAGPFRLMGEDPADVVKQTPEAVLQDEFDRDLLKLLRPYGQWIIADTSCGGISGGGRSIENLYDEGSVRSRAMGRIALFRQYLELAILLSIRAAEDRAPGWLNAYKGFVDTSQLPAMHDLRLLVDGPLLLTYRRRERLSRILQGAQASQIEKTILARTVGVVKGHRLKPKDMEKILSLKVGFRSRAYDLTREVEIGGQAVRNDTEPEDDLYPSRHIVTYVRLYDNPASALSGLVRLDLHRAALDPNRANETGSLVPMEALALDKWAAAVYRERRPCIQTIRPQPYPITLLEEILHARLLPSAVIHRLGK